MNERVKFWLIKAFEDWKAVTHVIRLEEEEIPTSVVCFHAHQFVEKLLKAYLTLKKIPFPATKEIIKWIKEAMKK
jgi:HEPN domain-containing protein